MDCKDASIVKDVRWSISGIEEPFFIANKEASKFRYTLYISSRDTYPDSYSFLPVESGLTNTISIDAYVDFGNYGEQYYSQYVKLVTARSTPLSQLGCTAGVSAEPSEAEPGDTVTIAVSYNCEEAGKTAKVSGEEVKAPSKISFLSYRLPGIPELPGFPYRPLRSLKEESSKASEQSDENTKETMESRKVSNSVAIVHSVKVFVRCNKRTIPLTKYVNSRKGKVIFRVKIPEDIEPEICSYTVIIKAKEFKSGRIVSSKKYGKIKLREPKDPCKISVLEPGLDGIKGRIGRFKVDYYCKAKYQLENIKLTVSGEDYIRTITKDTKGSKGKVVINWTLPKDAETMVKVSKQLKSMPSYIRKLAMQKLRSKLEQKSYRYKMRIRIKAPWGKEKEFTKSGVIPVPFEYSIPPIPGKEKR